MTYLRKPRKDAGEIRCRSGRNVVEDDTMVVQVEQPRPDARLTAAELRDAMGFPDGRERKINKGKP